MEKSKRNYGVDLLRVLAMFYVVILHVCGKGAVLTYVNNESANYYIAWFFECAAYCAVDIFGLISGYVGFSAKNDLTISKLAMFWLRIVFYTLLITAAFRYFIAPEMVGAEQWLHAALPINYRQYWYLTAYFGLMILIPVLNAGVKAMSDGVLKAVCFFSVVFFMLLPVTLNESVYNLSGGYTMAWLCIMYVFGAALSRFGFVETIHISVPLVMGGAALLATWLTKTHGIKNLLNYTSPTVFACAVALLMLFSRIKIETKVGKKIVSLLSATSLSVYIIHVHPLIWEKYVDKFAMSYAAMKPLQMTASIIVAALAIYAACTAVDLIRHGLFELLHLKKLLSYVDKGALWFVHKVFGKKDSAPAE